MILSFYSQNLTKLLLKDDQGRNIFTISTRNDDYGKIYFWALDVGEPRREFVADSLEEFFGVDSFE
ncbi:SMI1/KNR4 family protein [Moheibacter sediminis]|uniref:SMI1-KNR4 cell-wall n=1 Tax=Moheibacter sediminis TaxID=1434700 RepID=A0A1W1ZE68_9FLAO|nr:SMI1/KNR4 family protein [Moheibacter sediminis]SMC46760.1 SMI1-KNR4 cell-wall [Moheibacter sediminis]